MSHPTRPGSRPFGHVPRPVYDPDRDDRAERIHAPEAPAYEHSQPAKRYVPTAESVPPPPLPIDRGTGNFEPIKWAMETSLQNQRELQDQGTELVLQRAELAAFKREVDAKLDALRTNTSHTFEIKERDSKIEHLEGERTQLQATVTVTKGTIEKTADENADESRWRRRTAITAIVGAIGFVLAAFFGWLVGGLRK